MNQKLPSVYKVTNPNKPPLISILFPIKQTLQIINSNAKEKSADLQSQRKTAQKFNNFNNAKYDCNSCRIYIDNKLIEQRLFPFLNSIKNSVKNYNRLQTDQSASICQKYYRTINKWKNKKQSKLNQIEAIRNHRRQKIKTQFTNREDQIVTLKNKLSTKYQSKSKLEKLWQQKNIPECHQNYIYQIIQAAQPYRQIIIQKQINNIKNKSSIINYIMISIAKRESCLKNLKQLIQQLKMLDSNKNSELCSKLLEQILLVLSDLRNFSLDTVEDILRWKQQIEQMYQKYLKIENNNIKFELKKKINSNYLIRILKDNIFIKQSNLFPNATYPDPFFISYPISLEPQTELYYKIRASQLFLLQESLKI